jgi:hypothetical protein
MQILIKKFTQISLIPLHPLIHLHFLPLYPKSPPVKQIVLQLFMLKYPSSQTHLQKSLKNLKKMLNAYPIFHHPPQSSPTTPKPLTPILVIPQKYTQFERREASIAPPVPNNSPTTNNGQEISEANFKVFI